MIRAIFRWQNNDATQDLNDRFKAMLGRGVFEAGDLVPVSGELKVDLQPFTAISNDGMLVVEDTPQRFTLTLDQTTVIALHAVHNIGGDPTLDYGTFEISVFNAMVDRDEWIAFGTVTVLTPAVQATVNDISYAQRDENTKRFRDTFRGRVSSQTVTVNLTIGNSTVTTASTATLSAGQTISGIGIPSATSIVNVINSTDFVISNPALAPGGTQAIVVVDLPRTVPNKNQPGDFYMVNQGSGDLAELYAWNGVTWLNITNTLSIGAELANHRANLFANEIHLTDDQADAALGSMGAPSFSNRYVTELDTRLPSQDENDALQGSDGLPSTSNKYITQEYPVAAATQILFALPPGGPIQIASSQGPTFVGSAGIGSANKYFTLLDFNLKRGYVNSIQLAPQVVGVFTDALLTQPLDPSTNLNVDSDGFFTGDLYLQVDTVVDSGFRLVYGKNTPIGSVSKTFTIDSTPGDDTIPSKVVEKLSNIKGRTFDDSVPSREQNINLRLALDGIQEYLGSVLETNVIAADEDYTRLSSVPNLGPSFVKNIGVAPVYTFSNTGLNGFVYTASTGIVLYNATPSPVNLGSVRLGDRFLDANSTEYLITAKTANSVTIQDTVTGLIPAAIVDAPSGVGTAVNGSIKVNNNPRNLLLSEMKFNGSQELVPVRQITEKQDEFSKPAGSVAYGVLQTDQRFEPRVVFYGAFENYIDTTTGEQYVRNAGLGEINITGYFTEVALVCRRRSNSPALNVSIDAQAASAVSTSELGKIADAVATIPGEKYHRVLLASNLPVVSGVAAYQRATNITARIAAVAAGPLDIFGIEIVRSNDSSSGLLESGRAFNDASLIKRDDIDFTVPVNQLGAFARGGRTLVGVTEQSFDISITQLTDLDGLGTAVGQSPNGPVTTSTTINVNVNVNKLVGYKAGDIIYLLNQALPPVVEIRRIVSIVGTVVTIDSPTTIPVFPLANFTAIIRHVCSTDSTISNPEESQIARYALTTGTDFINNTSLDFRATNTATNNNRYVLHNDGFTLVAGNFLSIQKPPVISGAQSAVQIDSGGTLRITALCTRLDIIVNNVAAAAPVTVTIDGSPGYTYTFNGGGATRRTIFYNARYQSHEVVITGGGGILNISEIILFGPQLPTLPVDAVQVSDSSSIARYNPSTTSTVPIPYVYPYGGVFYEALHYISPVKGTGITTDWSITDDFTKSPYGRYAFTSNLNATAQFYFLGTAFELQYILGPDHGFFRVKVDGADLSTFPLNQVNGYGIGGRVDGYNATYTRKNVGVFGLSYGYHKIEATIYDTTGAGKNGSSSDWRMAFTGFYVGNDTGYMTMSLENEGNFSGVADTRAFVPLSSEQGITDENLQLLGFGVTPLTSIPNYSGRGSPLRTIGNNLGVLDAIASMDGQIDKFFGQLRLIPHESSVSKARVTGVDQTMLSGSILSQELNNVLMSFTGAVIDFTTGTITASDGVTALGTNFTPFAIPVGQYFWYGVTVVAGAVGLDNRIAATIQVQSSTAANAVQASAVFPQIPDGKKCGAVLVQNVAGVITRVLIRELGVGSGSSGSGSSGGAAVQPADGFQAIHSETFTEAKTDSLSSVRATETNASYDTHDPRKKYYRMSCDKTRTVTTVGTAYTLNLAPGFTVAAGDIIYHTSTGSWRRIATVTTQTTGTLDVAFSPNLAAQACMVSQAVWSVDIVNYGVGADGNQFKNLFGTVNHQQINLSYRDSLVSTDTVADFTATATVVASASNSGLVTDVPLANSDTFTSVYTRPLSAGQINNITLLSNATQQRLFLAFFPNPSNGSVTTGANLLDYDVSLYAETGLLNGGFLNSCYGQSGGGGTNNCTITSPTTVRSGTMVNLSTSITGLSTTGDLYPGMTVVSGGIFPAGTKIVTIAGPASITVTNAANASTSTNITFTGFTEITPNFDYVMGLNTGLPDGDLEVIVEGAEIPRNFGGVVGAFYNEVTSRKVQLYADLSTSDLSIHIRRRQGSIDSSDTNAQRLTALNDVVVGSAAQVAAGQATFTSLQAAHDAIVGNGRIQILVATIAESFNWTKQGITIEGKGYGSVLTGNMTVTSQKNFATAFKVTGNINLSASDDSFFMLWMGAGSTYTAGGAGNDARIIAE